MSDPTLTQIDDRELENMSVDAANFPYKKMRGMLYWDGSAWQKWTGALTAGSAALGSVNIRNTDGTDNSYTSGGVYGQKVHVVGISDLFAEGTIAAGSSLTGHKPVAIGFKDGSGNNQFAVGTTAGGLTVDLGTNNDVTITSGTVTANQGTAHASEKWRVNVIDALPTGSNAIGKLAANSGVDIGDVDVTSAIITGSSTAHDATDANNPIKIGAKAETSPAGVTLVADGDRTDLYADADGLLMTKPYTAYGDIKQGYHSVTATTSTAVTNLGAVASTRNFVTTIAVWNSSATDTYVKIQDGSGGTTIFVVPAPKGGGSVITFPVPLRQPTSNTGLYFATNDAVTTLHISFVGFQSKAWSTRNTVAKIFCSWTRTLFGKCLVSFGSAPKSCRSTIRLPTLNWWALMLLEPIV